MLKSDDVTNYNGTLSVRGLYTWDTVTQDWTGTVTMITAPITT